MFRTHTPWKSLLAVSGLLFLCLPVAAEHYLVYLIGGQSNANGRGDAAQLTEPLASPQKDVRFYWHRSQKTTNVGHIPENQWTDLAPGSGHGITQPVYPKEFGPELSFGRALADAHPEFKIAIVKYTVGGSNLSKQWSQNGGLYQTFVKTTRTALSALTQAGHTYELRGMIWQQGESDTTDKTSANYEKNLTALIQRVREDLFEGKSAPFSIGGLSASQNDDIKVSGTGWFVVRKAQETLAKTLPGVAFVNTDGFGTRPGDRIHFNHDGQIALGKAHAKAMLELEKQATQTPTRSAPHPQ